MSSELQSLQLPAAYHSRRRRAVIRRYDPGASRCYQTDELYLRFNLYFDALALGFDQV
jgi:hypothetical protein